MARESFDQELDRLAEKVLELGRDVEDSLQTMVEAMKNRDAGMAGQEIGADVGYKERGDDIEEECLVLQARQAPVAQDLRLIRTVQAVTNHLVRAGALCEHVCRGIAQTAEAKGDPELEVALLEMAHRAREVFGRGLDVFEDRDAQHARDLKDIDDMVDLLYSEALGLAVNPGNGGPCSPEWRVRAALAAHYLERIADHGVDIGKQTAFLVTGQRRHAT
jgi:phosphate transport system protein